MNILWVTSERVDPQSGGVARITYVMMEALRTRFGHAVYSVHKKEDFLPLIEQLGTCVVIVQNPCSWAKEVYDMKSSLPNVKIINVFHSTPGFEIVPLRWEIIKYRFCHNIAYKRTVKQLFLQIGMALLLEKYFVRLLRKKYSQPYGKADKIVVLSHRLIDQYQAIAPGNKDSFVAIPNALSFDNVTLPKTKEKEVLVVARLEDWHKRISEILEIWEEVQQDKCYNEWVLRIVGDGMDRPYYEAFVQRKDIPNICFEGRQDSLPYYQRASIFLMTSVCEGLPMTILEAQQCGCVPILYDSFASARDVIVNEKNGILIENREKKTYVAKLKELMSNEDLRQMMSNACVESSSRFSLETIADQWNELLHCL
jgi:glycosyltransferase involved in cell wall biosynthesis